MKRVRCISLIVLMPVYLLADSLPPLSPSSFSVPTSFDKFASIGFTCTDHVEVVQPTLGLTTSDFFETEGTFIFTSQIEKNALVPDYFYSINQSRGRVLDPNSKQTVFSYEAAYNGVDLQMLEHPQERLFLSKKSPTYDTQAYDANGLFLPFRFLSGSQSKLHGELTDLSSFSAKDWQKVKDIITSGKFTSSGDNRYITFKISTYNLDSQQNVTYEVSLDRNYNLYPTHWKMTGEKGQLIQEYAITELASLSPANNVFPLMYPRVSTLTYFLNDKIRTKCTVTVSNVEINKAIDPDLFTIDPAGAKTISQNGVLIDVPK